MINSKQGSNANINELKLAGSKLTLSQPPKTSKASTGQRPPIDSRRNPKLGISQSFDRVPRAESEQEGLQDNDGTVIEGQSTFFRQHGSGKNSVSAPNRMGLGGKASSQTSQRTPNRHVNQYLLTRGDPNEPCYQCYNRILRRGRKEARGSNATVQMPGGGATNSSLNGNSASAKRLPVQRDELQPHVVRLKTDEDFANNQRCLYFDKQDRSILGNLDPVVPNEAALMLPEMLGGMNLAGLEEQLSKSRTALLEDHELGARLEKLNQDIAEKEKHLQVIDDAQKVTANELMSRDSAVGCQASDTAEPLNHHLQGSKLLFSSAMTAALPDAVAPVPDNLTSQFMKQTSRHLVLVDNDFSGGRSQQTSRIQANTSHQQSVSQPHRAGSKVTSPANAQQSKTAAGNMVSGRVDLSLQGTGIAMEQPVTRVVLQSHTRRFRQDPVQLVQQSRNLLGDVVGPMPPNFLASLDSAQVPSTFLSASRSPIRKNKSGHGSIRLQSTLPKNSINGSKQRNTYSPLKSAQFLKAAKAAAEAFAEPLAASQRSLAQLNVPGAINNADLQATFAANALRVSTSLVASHVGSNFLSPKTAGTATVGFAHARLQQQRAKAEAEAKRALSERADGVKYKKHMSVAAATAEPPEMTTAGRAALMSERQLAIEIATQRIRPSKQTLTAGGRPGLSLAQATLSGAGLGSSAAEARNEADPALKFDAGSGTREDYIPIEFADATPGTVGPQHEKKAQDLFITQAPLGFDEPPIAPPQDGDTTMAAIAHLDDSDTAPAGSEDAKARRRAVQRVAGSTITSQEGVSDHGYAYRVDVHGPEFDFASQDRNLTKIKRIFEETSMQQEQLDKILNQPKRASDKTSRHHNDYVGFQARQKGISRLAQVAENEQNAALGDTMTSKASGRTHTFQRSRFFSAKHLVNKPADKKSFVFKPGADYAKQLEEQLKSPTASGPEQKTEQQVRDPVVFQRNSGFHRMLSRAQVDGGVARQRDNALREYVPNPVAPVPAMLDDSSQAFMLYQMAMRKQQPGPLDLVDDSNEQSKSEVLKLPAAGTQGIAAPAPVPDCTEPSQMDQEQTQQTAFHASAHSTVQSMSREDLQTAVSPHTRKLIPMNSAEVVAQHDASRNGSGPVTQRRRSGSFSDVDSNGKHASPGWRLKEAQADQLNQDRQTGQNFFFHSKQRRNKLHQQANQLALHGEKTAQGIKSPFFKAQKDAIMSQFGRKMQETQKGRGPAGASLRSSRRTAKSSENLTRSSNAQKSARSAVSYTSAQMRIPHPNANSNFYDRIMVRGPYNHFKGSCQVDNQVKQYTFEEWAQMRLSTKSVEKLERFGDRPAYTYKEPTAQSQLLGETTTLSQPPMFYDKYKQTQERYNLAYLLQEPSMQQLELNQFTDNSLSQSCMFSAGSVNQEEQQRLQKKQLMLEKIKQKRQSEQFLSGQYSQLEGTNPDDNFDTMPVPTGAMAGDTNDLNELQAAYDLQMKKMNYDRVEKARKNQEDRENRDRQNMSPEKIAAHERMKRHYEFLQRIQSKEKPKTAKVRKVREQPKDRSYFKGVKEYFMLDKNGINALHEKPNSSVLLALNRKMSAAGATAQTIEQQTAQVSHAGMGLKPEQADVRVRELVFGKKRGEEDCNFIKQQQLALMVPGYTNFILNK